MSTFSCYLLIVIIVKGAMSRFALLEKLSLRFSSSSFKEMLSKFFKFVVRRGSERAQ